MNWAQRSNRESIELVSKVHPIITRKTWHDGVVPGRSEVAVHLPAPIEKTLLVDLQNSHVCGRGLTIDELAWVKTRLDHVKTGSPNQSTNRYFGAMYPARG
jgi:hypothetical protein